MTIEFDGQNNKLGTVTVSGTMTVDGTLVIV